MGRTPVRMQFDARYFSLRQHARTQASGMRIAWQPNDGLEGTMKIKRIRRAEMCVPGHEIDATPPRRRVSDNARVVACRGGEGVHAHRSAIAGPGIEPPALGDGSDGARRDRRRHVRQVHRPRPLAGDSGVAGRRRAGDVEPDRRPRALRRAERSGGAEAGHCAAFDRPCGDDGAGGIGGGAGHRRMAWRTKAPAGALSTSRIMASARRRLSMRAVVAFGNAVRTK